VTGLQKETEETEETLAETLSVSGETVTAKDFTAVHRNGQEPRTTSGKNIPPSVTVKFHNISKKDKVLRNYKNYDFTNKKARTVDVKLIFKSSLNCPEAMYCEIF
jgi:hypothetical protein